MSCCIRKCLFALALVAAGAGWTLYYFERQKTAALEANIAALEAAVAQLQAVEEKDRPLIALLREDVEKTYPDRAKSEMYDIRDAYRTYYTQNLIWPPKETEVYSLLKGGEKAFHSPWPGVKYQVQIKEVFRQLDGVTIEQVVVTCQPPGEPLIQVPATIEV